MELNKLSIISETRWLQSEVQNIAGKIADSSISPKKYQYFFNKLNHALETLQTIEANKKMTNLFIQTQTKHLKEQVVQLYGDLENGLIKREISQIRKESTSLKNGRLTLKAIQKLETHINELEKNHLTSIPDRRIIADAKHALVEAKSKLEGKPIIKHFDWQVAQQTLRPVCREHHSSSLTTTKWHDTEASNFSKGIKEKGISEENLINNHRKSSDLKHPKPTIHNDNDVDLLPGDLEELFDIARAIYNRDFKQAKIRYNTLPEEHKKMFQKHMQNLMAKPFEDSLETMQAMIATANELVGNGESYPSSDQVDQLFLGLSQLNLETVIQPGFKVQEFK